MDQLQKYIKMGGKPKQDVDQYVQYDTTNGVGWPSLPACPGVPGFSTEALSPGRPDSGHS